MSPIDDLVVEKDDGVTTCILCVNPSKWYEMNCLHSGAQEEYARLERAAKCYLEQYTYENDDMWHA